MRIAGHVQHLGEDSADCRDDSHAEKGVLDRNAHATKPKNRDIEVRVCLGLRYNMAASSASLCG